MTARHKHEERIIVFAPDGEGEKIIDVLEYDPTDVRNFNRRRAKRHVKNLVMRGCYKCLGVENMDGVRIKVEQGFRL